MRSGAATAYLLVLDGPAQGTGFLAVEGDGDQVAFSAYLFLYDGPDGRADPAIAASWKQWIGERYRPMATDPAG